MRIFNPLNPNQKFTDYINDIKKDVENTDKYDKLNKGIVIGFVVMLMFGFFILGYSLNEWTCYAIAEKQCEKQCNDYACNTYKSCDSGFIFDNSTMLNLSKGIIQE